MKTRHLMIDRRWRLAMAQFFCLLLVAPAFSQERTTRWEFASIPDIHAGMRSGELSAVQLVDLFLARIEAYDKQGPSLNSIVAVNPSARERAAALDRCRLEGNWAGPLHGIPLIVKDNFDCVGLPTTAGSRSLQNNLPPDDAFQVRRLKEAGAIILAKSNMAEFAFSPYHSLSSMLGHTRNPYDLERVPAGSSGGTAAAVAAGLGVAGLGTDTGNSIRGPSSHCALVGIRSTMGLTSRDGVVPLYLYHDIAGPMARTVTDAAILLAVVAGTDAADVVTAEADAHKPASYTEFLDAGALAGKRIGVLRQISNRRQPDEEVLERFQQAIETLRSAGAILIDPVQIPAQEDIPLRDRWAVTFRPDLNAYLRSVGDHAPMKSLAEIVESGQFHESIEGSMKYFHELSPDLVEASRSRAKQNRKRLQESVQAVIEEHGLSVMIYPTWSHPPRKIGDLTSPHGDNSQDLSPHTGFPALTVPMGVVRDRLPVGLQILGPAWTEPTLIEIAYGYEQSTRHRQPPETTPPLK